MFQIGTYTSGSVTLPTCASFPFTSHASVIERVAAYAGVMSSVLGSALIFCMSSRHVPNPHLYLGSDWFFNIFFSFGVTAVSARDSRSL